MATVVSKSYLQIVYWKLYTYVVGPYKVRGTEYYKDKEATKLHSRDPYHAKRKTTVIMLGGVKTQTLKTTKHYKERFCSADF